MSKEASEQAMAEQDHHDGNANGNGHEAEPGAESAGKAESPLSGLQGIVEAILFVSGEPISVDRLQGVVEGVSRAELMGALRALQADYAVEGRGLQVIEVAGGFQIATRPDCAPWIKRMEKAKAGAKLSRSAMEALAIIAYKQPLVRAEMEQIRGVDTAGVLKTLLDRRLIRIVGRKDIPGRPIMYGTTKQFLQAFGLKDLAGLPALRDIKDLKEAEQFILPNVDPEEEASFGEAAEAAGPAPSELMSEAVAHG